MTPEERAAEIAEAENRWNPFIERYGLRNMNHEELARLIAAAIRDAVEAERKACAKVAHSRAILWGQANCGAVEVSRGNEAIVIAEAIEARSKESRHTPPPQR